MSHRIMTIGIVGAAVAMLPLVTTMAADEPSRQIDEELRNAQMEYVQTLRIAYESALAEHRTGRQLYLNIHDIHRELGNAMLEAATTYEQKANVLEGQVQVAKSHLKTAQARQHVGMTDAVDVVRAQAAYGRARIELLKLKASHQAELLDGAAQTDTAIASQPQTYEPTTPAEAAHPSVLPPLPRQQDNPSRPSPAPPTKDNSVHHIRTNQRSAKPGAKVDGESKVAAAGKPAEVIDTQLRIAEAEYRSSLETIVAMVVRKYQAGRVPLTSVLESQMELLEATVEAAQTVEEKIGMLEIMLETADRNREIVRARVENQLAGEVDSIQAKAGYLRIKLALLRLRRSALQRPQANPPVSDAPSRLTRPAHIPDQSTATPAVKSPTSDPLGPLPAFDPVLSPPRVTPAPGATLDPLFPSPPNEPVPAPTFGATPSPALDPLAASPTDPTPNVTPPASSQPGRDYFRDAARLNELASLKVKDKKNAESVLQELRLLHWMALSNRVNALKANWQAGVVGFEGDMLGEYVDALADLSRAELDLCKTVAERVTVCSSLLESSRHAETIIEVKHTARAEGGTIQAYAVAKAARLQAEIELLRERIRGDYWGPATQPPQIELPASTQPAVRRSTLHPSPTLAPPDRPKPADPTSLRRSDSTSRK